MADKKLVFDFKIDRDDYRDTVMCITFGSQKWKRIAMAIIWVLGTTGFVLNAFHVISLSSPMYACCLLVMVAIGGVWASAQISIYKYKDVYRKGKGIKRRIAVEDKGITFTNLVTNEAATAPWDEVYRVQETKTTYVIGVGKTDAVILPKRAILTEKDKRDFENIVQTNIHGRFMPM